MIILQQINKENDRLLELIRYRTKKEQFCDRWDFTDDNEQINDRFGSVEYV